MTLTIVAQLPNLKDMGSKPRYSRSLMPAVAEMGRLKPKPPSQMADKISLSTKQLFADALIESVKGLENAARSADIPSSISVASSTIPNGDGERLSIMLDMPTPVWDTSTFERLHNGTSNQDWESIDFNEFTTVWMSKRFLPIEGHKPITTTAA